MIMDSRSAGIFPILAAIAYKLMYQKNIVFFDRYLSGNFISVKVLGVVMPCLLILNFAASELFTSETFLSKLSIESANKYRTQASGEFGVLLGGRSEILSSWQAFMDKPLLGHGSWAKDNGSYLDDYAMLRYRLGYSLAQNDQVESIASEVLIPVHSFLMGGLVWAGLLGGWFWLVTLTSTVKIFIQQYNCYPFYFYIGMLSFIWNVFFSPFGAGSRWDAAVFLAAFYSYSYYINKNKMIL